MSIRIQACPVTPPSRLAPAVEVVYVAPEAPPAPAYARTGEREWGAVYVLGVRMPTHARKDSAQW